MSIVPGFDSDFPKSTDMPTKIEFAKKEDLRTPSSEETFQKPAMSKPRAKLSSGARLRIEDELDDLEVESSDDIDYHVVKVSVISEGNRLAHVMGKQIFENIKAGYRKRYSAEEIKARVLEITGHYSENSFMNPILMVELEILVKAISFEDTKNIYHFLDRLRQLIEVNEISE